MYKKFKKALWTMFCVLFVAVLLTVSVFAAKLPFVDVQTNRWSYEYIKNLYDAGIINGASATKFAPEANITRAEFVKILGGIEGINAKKYKGSDFDDVSANAWYGPYVKWAVKSGVTKGVSATRFDPNGQITRQDMATMIYRYVDFCDVVLKNKNKAINFSDGGSIASYAKTAVQTMQRAGIINGKKNSNDTYRFEPNSNATREEASKMLCLVYDAILKEQNDDNSSAPPSVDEQVTQRKAFETIKNWILDNANYQFDDGTLAYDIRIDEEKSYTIFYDDTYDEIHIGLFDYMVDVEASMYCAVSINPNDHTYYAYLSYTTFDRKTIIQFSDFFNADLFDGTTLRFDNHTGIMADDADFINSAEEVYTTALKLLLVYTDADIIYDGIGTTQFDMSIFGWDHY